MVSIVENDCPVRALSSGPESHFFGYYDKSPWNPLALSSGVLAHGTSKHWAVPEPGEPIRLGLVDDGGAFVPFAESRAWNFQQGSMLRWRPGSSSEVLFNDETDEGAVGVRLDLASGAKTTYERPFASVSPTGKEALSINFGRLTRMRPEYGYAGTADPFAGERLPQDDGIWHIDLGTGATRLLISYRQIVEIQPDPGMLDAEHYLNHVMYSGSGERFCFLHRYVNAAGTQNTRMFACNRDGTGLTLLISGLASHFGWLGDEQLLAWAGQRRLMGSATKGGLISRLPIGPMLKKLYRALGKPASFKAGLLNDRYILFDVVTGSQKTIGKGQLTTDGHCTFSPDGQWFVTDTYPDRNGLASLLLCHIGDERVYRAARFLMPPALDGAVRCDLHPRWHPDGQKICVDAATDASRQLFEIDVRSIVRGMPAAAAS